MNNVDIFSATNEKKMPSWAKFEKAGDVIQGTYVGKITGTIDGFGNAQIIYQLLKSGEVFNVAFGENKKVIHQDMAKTKFGQIVGFKFKGKLQVKNKVGKMVEVKDFGLYADPKIVDTEWLKENTDNMPTVTHVNTEFAQEKSAANQEFSNFGVSESSPVPSNDAPASVTPEDKLAIITKLGYDKLGITDMAIMKEKIMEITGVPFLQTHYDKIIASLNTIGQ